MNLLDNFEFYINKKGYNFKKQQLKILQEELNKNGEVYMTVEDKDKWKLELISFKIDNIYEHGGNIEFYYQMEQVFVYDGNKSLAFYLSPSQNEYYAILKQNNTRYTYDEITGFVDYCYEDYYHKAQNWLGTGSDIDRTANQLYMDKVSRTRLHEVVLRKKRDNFKKQHGCENQILKNQLEELLEYGV